MEMYTVRLLIHNVLSQHLMSSLMQIIFFKHFGL